MVKCVCVYVYIYVYIYIYFFFFFYSHDGMSDWEQQHHQRVSFHISLAQEKIKIQNSKFGCHTTHIIFVPL